MNYLSDEGRLGLEFDEAVPSPPPMRRSAEFSVDVRHRYALEREWGEAPRIMWLMLNPSTADAVDDDPTIRRCIAFSRGWGYGALTVCNLWSLRATDPRLVLPRPGVVSEAANVDAGGRNRRTVLERAHGVPVVVAWGARPAGLYYPKHLATEVQRVARALVCLGTTADGNPRHPLYVKGDTVPQFYPTGETWEPASGW